MYRNILIATDGSDLAEKAVDHGVAMAEAKDGICTICHVRLRPQVFNTVLKNEAVIQCDHCQRILYFVPSAPATGAATP